MATGRRATAARGRGRRAGRLGALLAILLVAFGAALPAAALARPPRTATIVEQVGMAGVRVGTNVALDRGLNPQRVTSGPMSTWGPVFQGFCFEATACAWRIPGGGFVNASISERDNELLELATSSRRWVTRRGAHAGDTVLRVQRLYRGRLTRMTTCQLGGFGAELDVLVLRGRRRTTAFELRDGRVRAIWVVAQRLSRDECSDAAQEVTRAGVGDVKLGATFRSLRRAGLVGPLRRGCEFASPRARSAALRAPLVGSVDFTRASPRRVANIAVTGGATARGVGVGDRARAVRRAFPRARFDHSTDRTFGVTIAHVPRRGGGPLQFAIDTRTRRVDVIGVPAVPFCE